jgi:hypothetical protein
MEDAIIMTRKQLTRYNVVRKAIGGVVTIKEAAALQGAPEAGGIMADNIQMKVYVPRGTTCIDI